MPRATANSVLAEIPWYPKGSNPCGEAVTDDGEHNLLYWAWELKRCHEFHVECMKSGIDWDVTRKVKAIKDTMGINGIESLADLGSNKTQYFFDHEDDLFERTEAQLDEMEKQCAKLIKSANNHAVKLITDGVDLTDEQKKRIERTIKIIRRVRRLQRFCAKEIPTQSECRAVDPKCKPIRKWMHQPLKWTHPLRTMLYCERSSASGWFPIMALPNFTITMAMDLGYAEWAGFQGYLLMEPPGHGKTVFGKYWMINRIRKNPDRLCGVFHHKSDDAKTRLGSLAQLLLNDTPVGRRYTAMFPNKPVILKKRFNSHQFYVPRRSSAKDPTCRAWGINEAGQGRDLHDCWFDDIVDSKERYEPSTRDKTYRNLTGTWLPRLRGSDTFWLVTCTPWHLDDAYHRLMKSNRANHDDKGGDFRTGIWRVGTREDKFHPLWDRYNRKFLKRRHRQLGGLQYDCLYRLRPASESAQIVKKLCFVRHEPDTHEEDAAYRAQSKCVISVDPSGTARERTDKAGIVIALVNEFKASIRVVEAVELSINQPQLAAYLVEAMHKYSAAEVLIECHGGMHATADCLEHDYDLDPQSVIRMTTQNMKKEARLRACALWLENGKVSFRGQAKKDGSGFIGREEHKWLYDQIREFGAVPGDHALDAVTQLCQRYASLIWEAEDPLPQELAIGGSAELKKRDPRLVQHLKKLRRARQQNRYERDPVLEEVSMFNAQTERSDWSSSWN